jgi:hypothetical protein
MSDDANGLSQVETRVADCFAGASEHSCRQVGTGFGSNDPNRASGAADAIPKSRAPLWNRRPTMSRGSSSWQDAGLLRREARKAVAAAAARLD